MTDYGADNPYKTLGWHLKFAREQLKKSLVEVSGAVEIDVDTLNKIERGDQRPSEEVLLLLISHLGLEDAEATSLWELAGYDSITDNSDNYQQVTVAMPMDLRVVYTDLAHVTSNDYGVVMNFMQSGPGNQPLAVARVGMSKKHAVQVLKMLHQALAKDQSKSKPMTRSLPIPKKRPGKSTS